MISCGHLSVRQTKKEKWTSLPPRSGALPALSPPPNPASLLPSRSSGAGSPIAAPLRGHCWGSAGGIPRTLGPLTEITTHAR